MDGIGDHAIHDTPAAGRCTHGHTAGLVERHHVEAVRGWAPTAEPHVHTGERHAVCFRGHQVGEPQRQHVGLVALGAGDDDVLVAGVGLDRRPKVARAALVRVPPEHLQ